MLARTLIVGLTLAAVARADDPAMIAKTILDDKTPQERRLAMIREHIAIAPELIVAMTADLKPGPEEYRRIPWIWRVAIAAGRRNDAKQLKRLLEVSLPKSSENLRDWQAVVVGGGVINGVSLQGKWPTESFKELLKDDAELSGRWTAALKQAHSMADNATVPMGTRYDALRMIALDSWEKCGTRLSAYLKKEVDAELQMGAISGLSDIDRKEVATLLADGLPHFASGNRKLAIDALLRTAERRAVLQDRLDSKRIEASWLDEMQIKALGTKEPGLTELDKNLNSHQRLLLQTADALTREAEQAYLQGRYPDAIRPQREAIEKYRQVWPEGHEQLAVALHRLADIERDRGRSDLAVAHYRESIALYRRFAPHGSTEMGKALGDQGLALLNDGKVAAARESLEESVAMLERLFPKVEFPNGDRSLADALTTLSRVELTANKLDLAHTYVARALEMQRKLLTGPKGHIDLLTSLTIQAMIDYQRGRFDDALASFLENLEMARRLYPVASFPNGHPNLATAINNVAALSQLTGRLGQALKFYEESLAMRRRQFPLEKYPSGHPDLIQSLSNLGALCKDMGLASRALEYHHESMRMARGLYPPDRFPNGHDQLLTALGNYLIAIQENGRLRESLAIALEQLEIARKLYPKDKGDNAHANLIHAAFLAGVTHGELKNYDESLKLIDESIAGFRVVFPKDKHPNGHPQLAASLNARGYILKRAGRAAESLDSHREALAMREALFPAGRFPNGHPDLFASMSNVALALADLNRYAEAREVYDRLLSLVRRLYAKEQFPNGHTMINRVLYQRALADWKTDGVARALPQIQEALDGRTKLQRTTLELLPESNAMAAYNMDVAIRDGYLTATREARTDAASVYRRVWAEKSMLIRILEQRHEAARINRASNPKLAEKYRELAETRHEIGRVLNRPSRDKSSRDARLKELTDQRDQLERDLVAALPTLNLRSPKDAPSPDDLIRALPAGHAFIDCIPYWNMNVSSQLAMAVFVIAPGQSVQRFDLLEFEKVDDHVYEWIASISNRNDKPARQLSQILWEPIARRLPPDTTTLYVSGERSLAQLPWCALPLDDRGTIVLDRFAVAHVLNGPHLHKALTDKRGRSDDSRFLLVGNLNYDSPKWPSLPGTKSEIESIRQLATGDLQLLAEKSATTSRVAEELSRATIAHLATHGFYDGRRFDEERDRAEAIGRRAAGSGSESLMGLGLATLSPLAYSGLVVSGGDQVTGETIAGLWLERLDLCVLSACESGQGAVTSGDGLLGLIRAFHLAGCPNVVASLWKVNDAATAALMAKFYHELWVNKKEPLAALREAQLFIYHNPDRIPDVLGERGAPKRTEALAVKTTGTSPGVRKDRADTKLWAAFILSGVGK